MKKAIIIGATSGIGWELAKIMSNNGYELGLTGRRVERLVSLANAQPGKVIHPQFMDVTEYEKSRQTLLELIQRMGGVDVIIINSGFGQISSKWEIEDKIIRTNAHGFAALANASYRYFIDERDANGHIVGISSLAAIRGSGLATTYNASKAFISSYMQGLRYRSMRKNRNIAITDIRPGFVETPMTEQNDFMFWVAPAEKAAQQIYDAIQKKKKVAYITKRWAIIAFLMRLIPDFIYGKNG